MPSVTYGVIATDESGAAVRARRSSSFFAPLDCWGAWSNERGVLRIRVDPLARIRVFQGLDQKALGGPNFGCVEAWIQWQQSHLRTIPGLKGEWKSGRSLRRVAEQSRAPSLFRDHELTEKASGSIATRAD